MRKHAFTFIEIMISITVFAIGVLAVLRLLTSNLVSMDKTENRTIATFLAKEGLEMVYNIRDANIEKGLPRNCLLTTQVLTDQFAEIDPDNACEWYFSSGANDGNVLSLGFSASGYFFAERAPLGPDFMGNFSTFELIQMTGLVDEKIVSRYAPRQEDQTSSNPVFGRYVVFTGVVDGDKLLPLTDIIKVESHVLFFKGASTGEIVLESLIGKQ